MHVGSAVERFWRKVNKNGPVPEARPDLGPCWIWTAGKTEAGYGRFTVAGRQRVMAYRFSYELGIGPFPGGFEPDHLCRNRACVNWNHLQVLTHKQNTLASTSFSAVNAAKTHCDNGHEFTPENTYVNKTSGSRQCQACMRKFRKEREERMAPGRLKKERKDIRRRYYLRHRTEILEKKRAEREGASNVN